MLLGGSGITCMIYAEHISWVGYVLILGNTVNRTKIWRVNMGRYMGFRVHHLGSAYYATPVTFRSHTTAYINMLGPT